jgi:hypothetical protein
MGAAPTSGAAPKPAKRPAAAAVTARLPCDDSSDDEEVRAHLHLPGYNQASPNPQSPQAFTPPSSLPNSLPLQLNPSATAAAAFTAAKLAAATKRKVSEELLGTYPNPKTLPP